ncbi:MAG: DUF2306 domain-containing protein [Micrococcales bacterium]|nr:DUF2306 domain-containing protein [Micrococcales bacterium]OJX66705.1 MAG: hypothetical protein BGO94_07625 [Micrococcales bacterium 72-143]
MTAPVRAPGKAPSGWLAITGLILLTALPVIGGVVRVRDVGAGATSSLPLPLTIAIVVHIVAMSLYCFVGAFQFSPALRARRRWHRTAGRVLIPLGLAAALAGVALVLLFHGPDDEYALALVRLVFCIVMTVYLVLGAIAIVRRRFAAHGAWMTRAYAIGIAGGTQALLVTLFGLVVGDVDPVRETWLVAAGFFVNLAVAEWRNHRRLQLSRAPQQDG